MIIRNSFLTIVISVTLLGCETHTIFPFRSPKHTPSPTQLVSIYASADASSAWYIQGRSYWSGAPHELRVAPLTEARATIAYSRTANASCVDLDGVSTFGAPDDLRKGTKFECGAARFEVADCDFPEACRNARIEAIWRTGAAPNYHELPVNYFYNVCRGVQAITFSQNDQLRVQFGSTLELRQGLGLLAQPEGQGCKSDPTGQLYR